ncbi:virginiamycin B lyase family protein [Candidatus Leptofilum sp.]|uniref:Vgb family protein n=1 Tax=Candidatus Leptofilum sp. TaxID=3241576 RepID=UPI003B59D9E2
MIKKTRIFLILIVTAMMMATAVWLLAEEQGAPSTTSGFITEYPIPIANSAPQSIVVETSGPPATVWFTMPDADAIGRLVVTDTLNFTFTTFGTMDGITTSSAPHDLVYAAANSLIWFTEPGNASLGRLDTTNGNITEIPLPDNHVPLNLDIAPNGLLYMTSPTTNHLLSYDPGSTNFTLYPYDATGGNPTHIDILGNNSIWITSPATNHVAEIKPSTGSNFIKIPVQDFGIPPYPPSGLTLDGSAPWITANSMNRVGRYAEGTLTFWRWYEILPENSGAGAIAYTSASTFKYLWFVQTDLGRVGRMTLNSSDNDLLTLSAHALAGTDSRPTDIAVDENGIAWITGKGSNVIGQWVPPYATYVNLPLIQKP